MIQAFVISTIFASLFCAIVPASLFVINLRKYRAPTGDPTVERISILIPARNEERNIASCLNCVLASETVSLEILVLDDASTDRTADIVKELAMQDSRIRLLQSATLPNGWNGKQHACWQLAKAATSPLLLFLDADVRLAPSAVSNCAGQLRSSHIAMLSGIPRIITAGWMERLLLPLIHFVLLSFLPMWRMRKTVKPAYAAGCGQLLLVQADAYFASGGHAAIRATRHDGLRLPETFRRHGFRTDIFDLTSLAEVRMYDSPRAVWQGLAKNATEGIATPLRIVPFTILLVLGQILPALLFPLLLAAFAEFAVVGAHFDQPVLVAAVSVAVLLATTASYVPRLMAVRRFQQPLLSAFLHPLGVALLLVVQWYALLRHVSKRPIAWRDRVT
jgi:cellulose synthase/poly-beta-1,6-N-acetylglucosamine synthase-like glycosyltransferase